MEKILEYDHVQRCAAFGTDSTTHQHFGRLVPPSVDLRPACGAHTWGSVPLMPLVEADFES